MRVEALYRKSMRLPAWRLCCGPSCLCSRLFSTCLLPPPLPALALPLPLLQSLSGPNGFPALVEGREFNVTYIVQNLGTGPAYAVSLSDEWDTSSFKMVRAHGGSFSPAGAISASWNQLMP